MEQRVVSWSYLLKTEHGNTSSFRSRSALMTSACVCVFVCGGESDDRNYVRLN